MPGRLLQSKALRQGSVSFGKRVFDRKTGKAREFRIHAVFPVANRPVTYPHGLGRVPTFYSPGPARRNPASGAPGTVYDRYPWATRTHVTFYCTAANTRAEIILR